MSIDDLNEMATDVEHMIKFNPTVNQEGIRKGVYIRFDSMTCGVTTENIGRVLGLNEEEARERRRRITIRRIKVDGEQKPGALHDYHQPVTGKVTLTQKYDA